MGIKLFVTDLDGTLLNRQHKISERNKQAVQKAVAAGTTVTVATGRMYPSARPYAEELGVDVPIITYNGAVIKTVSGEVIDARYLEAGVAKDILAFCREKKWYIQVYYNDALYFVERNEKARSYEKAAGVSGFPVGEKLWAMCDNVPKMLIVSDDVAKTDDIVNALHEKFSGKIFATKSNPDYVEIVHPLVNKAAALETLMKRLNLRLEEVMAIGDSNNDLPMLKYAGKSVAMGNAGAHVKEVCAYVTEDCDDDGVAVAIERYVLADK